MSVETRRGESRAGIVGTASAAVGDARRSVRRRIASLYFGDWFVILLTVGAAALAGGGLAGPVGAGLALGLGGTVAAAVGIANSRNPLLTALGAGVVSLGGVLTAAMLALVAFLGLQSGLTGLVWGFGLGCLALAATGAFLTPVRDISSGAILRTSLMASLAGGGVLFVLVGRLLPEGELRGQAVDAVGALSGAAVGALVTASPATGVATFLLTLGVAALSLRAVQTRVPVERLLPADKRDAASRVLSVSRVWLSRTCRGGLALGLVMGVLTVLVTEPAATTGPTTYVELLRLDGLTAALPGPLGSLAAVLFGAASVRTALLSVTVVSALVAAGITLARRLRRGLGWLLVRLAAPVVGGAVFGTVAGTTLADPSLPARLATAAPEAVPDAVVVLLADLPLFAAANVLLLFAMAVFGSALTGLLVLRGMLVLPKRAGSAALASVGLFGVAVVAAIVGRVPLGLGVTVVAMAVWDVGEFRTGLSEELPATAPTLRAEVVHASASLVTGGVVAALSWAVFVWVVPAVSPSDPRVAGAGLVVVVLVAGLLLTKVSG